MLLWMHHYTTYIITILLLFFFHRPYLLIASWLILIHFHILPALTLSIPWDTTINVVVYLEPTSCVLKRCLNKTNMKQLLYDLLVSCASSIQLIEIVVFCWIGLCVNNQYKIGRKGKRPTIYLSWCCRCVVQIPFHFLEHHTKTHQRRRRLPYCDVGSWSRCIKVGLCGVEKERCNTTRFSAPDLMTTVAVDAVDLCQPCVTSLIHQTTTWQE